MTTERKMNLMITLIKCAMEQAEGIRSDARTGAWQPAKNWGYTCSECRIHAIMRTRFCPSCGARMEEQS